MPTATNIQPRVGPARPDRSPRGVVREQFVCEFRVPRDGAFAPELLAEKSALSKSRIKDAMKKGAVWVHRGTRKPERLRRATSPLRMGDRLALYYDSAILDRVPAPAALVADCTRYSVWNKPAGLLVEGSRFGDHATLLQQCAESFEPARRVWLVHRLDLEAIGLILIAHTREAAARLSALFQARAVHKRYAVEVSGNLGDPGMRGKFNSALEGKAAITEYRIVAFNAERNFSCIEITMLSGRHHQIRRHLTGAGHPVLGDSKYGRATHLEGLRLAAVHIGFTDPWEARERVFSIAEDIALRWGWDVPNIGDP